LYYLSSNFQHRGHSVLVFLSRPTISLSNCAVFFVIESRGINLHLEIKISCGITNYFFPPDYFYFISIFYFIFLCFIYFYIFIFIIFIFHLFSWFFLIFHVFSDFLSKLSIFLSWGILRKSEKNSKNTKKDEKTRKTRQKKHQKRRKNQTTILITLSIYHIYF